MRRNSKALLAGLIVSACCFSFVLLFSAACGGDAPLPEQTFAPTTVQPDAGASPETDAGRLPPLDNVGPRTPLFQLLDPESGSNTETLSQSVEVLINDDGDAVGWYLTESTEAPIVDDPRWLTSSPTTFNLSAGFGQKTVRMWTRDVAWNLCATPGFATIRLLSEQEDECRDAIVDVFVGLYFPTPLDGDGDGETTVTRAQAESDFARICEDAQSRLSDDAQCLGVDVEAECLDLIPLAFTASRDCMDSTERDPVQCRELYDGDGPSIEECLVNLTRYSTCAACITSRMPVETCDGFDNDCDGNTDEGMLNVCGECGPVPDEICFDGVDNDCDEEIDEECCPDLDDDGFTDEACGGQDCDDDNENVNPGETEVCDPLNVDEDCSGTAEDVTLPQGAIFFPDGDEDTYGTTVGAVVACEAPAGFVSRDADCDDDDPAVNPDAVEVCDGVDNDCDDEVDVDDAGDLVTQACYEGLPPETEGIGVCRGGIETCQAGGTFGPCLGQVIPSDELAGNLVDEDCDGLLDGLDPSCVNCCTEAEGPRDCSDLDLACEVGVCDVVSGICTTEWSDLCCTDADGPDTQCTEMFPDANPDVPDYLWGCEIGATEDNPGFCTTCRDSDGLWDCGVEVCANDLDEDGDGEVDEAGCVECTSTSDCLAGEVCNLVTNVCEVPADCTFDTDCVDVPAAVCDGDDNVITFRGLCGADGSCTYPESTTRMVCDFGCALGECLPECDAASDCNDGLFCTGTETCNAGGLCVAGGGNPCLVGTPYCVEASDSCVECTADAHCGADEFCSAGVCTPTIGATELRVTWTNASTPEAPVGTTLRLQMACFNATGGSVISWGVYATGPRDAASITAVVDFNGAAWCKVNIVAVNAFGVGVWWAAQADALGAPDISGVLSYLLGTRAVTSVTTRPNSETCSSGGYDWAFWPGTDSDGDKVCDGAAPAAPPFCTPAAPPFCAAGPDPTPNG